MDKYYREKFHLHDPALRHCHCSWHPLPWTSELFAAPETRPIYEEARLHGISAGCAVPISPASSGFSFVRDEDADAALPDVLRVLPSMALLSGFVMEAVNVVEAKAADRDPPQRLSNREVECLKLMAAGCRDSDIAERLNITLRTVVAHITNGRRKIGASNRAQLIAKCISLGII
jgi:LuxR family transcriptional regulator, quorum-sensing system regulator LasR